MKYLRQSLDVCTPHLGGKPWQTQKSVPDFTGNGRYKPSNIGGLLLVLPNYSHRGAPWSNSHPLPLSSVTSLIRKKSQGACGHQNIMEALEYGAFL